VLLTRRELLELAAFLTMAPAPDAVESRAADTIRAGRIGMTELEARAQKRKYRVAKMPMNYVARALEVDEARGFMKAIVDSESDQILGAAVLGIEGGEIMAMLQLAMMGRLPFTTLREGIFAHPTLAESLNNLFTHFV